MTGERTAELRAAAEGLLSGYRRAIRDADSVDVLTKAEVVRSIIDSGNSAVAALRTRHEGVQDLVAQFDAYVDALRREDLVGRTWQAGKQANTLLLGTIGVGLTLGGVSGFAIDFIGSLVRAGEQLGAALPKLLAYSGVSYFLLRGLGAAYEEYEKSKSAPPSVSAAATILRRWVDPTEAAFYAVAGGSRPIRTFDAVNSGLSIVIGGVAGLFAAAVVAGLLGDLT